ncbi:MAG: hypothetical protein Q9218_005989 [Villophora microphyllina]
MDRHTICEYPIDSSNGAIAHWRETITIPAPTAFDSLTTSPETHALSEFPLGNTTSGNILPGGMGTMMAEDNVNMDWEIGLNDGDTTEFWQSRAWNFTPTEIQAMSSNIPSKSPAVADMLLSTAVSTHDFGQPYRDSDFLADVTADFQSDHVENTTDLHSKPVDSATSLLKLPARPSLSKDFGKASETRKRRTTSTDEGHMSPNAHASRTQVSNPPPTPYSPLSLQVSPALHVSPDGSTRTSPEQSNGFSEMNSPGDASSTPSSTVSEAILNNEVSDVDYIMKVICEYPKQMLRYNFWSPFVHHRYYRCSQGGLAEPMAVALCCISANQQNAQSSLPFLCKLINTERERIVNEFPTKSGNLEDAMAALHAMCIYQIETILVFRSRDPVKQQLSSAELYHHFLLKMTRRLCQEHMDKVSLKTNTAISWHKWTLIETLRRTAFLVNMVNELSHHSNALRHVYYEPLDPSLVLDMPLPAPDSMWRAINEDEWIAARDSSGWTGSGVLTLREAMRSECRGPSNGHSLNNIEQISNLIISCARQIGQQQVQQRP